MLYIYFIKVLSFFSNYLIFNYFLYKKISSLIVKYWGLGIHHHHGGVHQQDATAEGHPQSPHRGRGMEGAGIREHPIPNPQSPIPIIHYIL